MFVTNAAQIGAALMAAVCLFAAWPGARPQRWAAAGVFVAWMGSAALQNRDDLINPQYAIFALDIVATTLFLGLALAWRRTWLMAMAGFQLLTTATHVAVMIDLRIWVYAYLSAYLVWSYALLASLAWGGVLAWRERADARSR